VRGWWGGRVVRVVVGWFVRVWWRVKAAFLPLRRPTHSRARASSWPGFKMEQLATPPQLCALRHAAPKATPLAPPQHPPAPPPNIPTPPISGSLVHVAAQHRLERLGQEAPLHHQPLLAVQGAAGAQLRQEVGGDVLVVAVHGLWGWVG